MFSCYSRLTHATGDAVRNKYDVSKRPPSKDGGLLLGLYLLTGSRSANSSLLYLARIYKLLQ
jgi:hypothetical protein